jgi:hypothetical protein
LYDTKTVNYCNNGYHYSDALFLKRKRTFMAEFCTKCASRWGMTPDFDEKVLTQKCQTKKEISVFCEGCGLVSIRKAEDKIVEYGYYKSGEVVWIKQISGLV